MVKIIVIEKDEKIVEKLKKVIRQVSIKEDKELDVKYYQKYDEDLKKEIENLLFPKVYIIGIVLENEKSGIEVAQIIREKDLNSEIIFVTNHDNLFEITHRRIRKIFDFIETFHDMEHRLQKDLEKILAMNEEGKLIKIKNNANHEVEIYRNRILYITRDKEERKAIIHTDAKEAVFTINGTLAEIVKLDSNFVQTHKSCIVNKKRVIEKNYGKGYIKFDTGEKIELLSKTYHDAFNEEQDKIH